MRVGRRYAFLAGSPGVQNHRSDSRGREQRNTYRREMRADACAEADRHRCTRCTNKDPQAERTMETSQDTSTPLLLQAHSQRIHSDIQDTTRRTKKHQHRRQTSKIRGEVDQRQRSGK